MFFQQTIEDGTQPSLKWEPDRDASDEEEPDQKMFLPMADATKRHTDKLSSIRDWPDDEDDSDIEVMEAFDVVPFFMLFRHQLTPVGRSMKILPLPRGGASVSSFGHSKPTKRRNKSADKAATKSTTKAVARRARKPKDPLTSDE